MTKAAVPLNPRLSDMSQVTVRFEHDHRAQRYLVLKTQVDTFVKATVRLHHYPGVNPHNGKQTSRMCLIEVSDIVPTGPFWWTTPDLQNNGDPCGATVYQDRHTTRVWSSPAQLKAEDRLEEMED